jgi:hypothetical protein
LSYPLSAKLSYPLGNEVVIPCCHTLFAAKLSHPVVIPPVRHVVIPPLQPSCHTPRPQQSVHTPSAEHFLVKEDLKGVPRYTYYTYYTIPTCTFNARHPAYTRICSQCPQYPHIPSMPAMPAYTHIGRYTLTMPAIPAYTRNTRIYPSCGAGGGGGQFSRKGLGPQTLQIVIGLS